MKKTRNIVVSAVIILITLLSLVVCLSGVQDFSPKKTDDYTPVGYKKADGDYCEIRLDSENNPLKIAVMGDPQICFHGKYDIVGASNDATWTFLEKMLTAKKPDLLVLDGDVIMSQLLNNYPYWIQLAELMESLSVYWCYVYGNHDSQTEYQASNATADSYITQVPKPYLTEAMMEYPHCLTYDIPTGDNGNANFMINILDYSGSYIYTLCMLDCVNDFENNDMHRYATASQVEFYDTQIDKISELAYGADYDTPIPSMVFTHVPFGDMGIAYNKLGTEEVTWKYGYMKGISKGETEIFQKILEKKSTTAAFFGHYHDYDMCLNYKGVDLVFVQHSGFSHSYRVGMNEEQTQFDFSEIIDWGDSRGYTEITITQRGDYSLAQVFGRDVIPDYKDFSIDYEELMDSLSERGFTVVGGEE